MIPFNKPLVLGTEIKAIEKVLIEGKISGGNKFYKQCVNWFQENIPCAFAIPTPSCTAALEMGLMLADIKPGDEVILPSFTFPSTATAIVLHGGVPVFIDSRPNTFNINEDLIESAITNKTKMILPVHYGGISCDMKKIMFIASKYNLIVLEDAAQCIRAMDQDGKAIGSKGHMSAFSFHETKNITCGEGGMLCINDENFVERAEIVRDKGTNRQQFFRGQVDKYSWRDKGSSYLMSELQAAYLYSQLKVVDEITNKRRSIWNFYHKGLEKLATKGNLSRPDYAFKTYHNGHLYPILLSDDIMAMRVLEVLNDQEIGVVIHYVPLHSSSAGKKFGRIGSEMVQVNDFAKRLLRLPLYVGLSEDEQLIVIQAISNALT